MDIFKKRESLLPEEYPQLSLYKEAIRHSYWVHTEFNLTSDVQDFKVNVSDAERAVIEKTMLAISQIEVSVKTFWALIYLRMPKPEIAGVGMTFAESEARHSDAYSFLLQQLGLAEKFNDLLEVPVIRDRIDYLSKYLDGTKSKHNRDFTKSVLLFSMFVEHVSLFSQFLIMMSFNRYKNLFKGINNIVLATSKEEEIHGKFGAEVINIIKKENKSWFNKELEIEVKNACVKAFEAECGILDWIFEEGELEFISKNDIIEFIKNRFNNSLISIGYKKAFNVDEEVVNNFKWFDLLLTTGSEKDFFDKRSTDYSKFQNSINAEDLF